MIQVTFLGAHVCFIKLSHNRILMLAKCLWNLLRMHFVTFAYIIKHFGLLRIPSMLKSAFTIVVQPLQTPELILMVTRVLSAVHRAIHGLML